MLSRPWNQRKPHYDFVVVGSGYGGSIAAARLATASLARPVSVCLLERGREWPVGTFPDTFEKIGAAARSAANPLGLYETVAGRDISVIKGSGLGGTSLVNANVAIVPSRDVFGLPGWPSSLTLDLLLPYYARARQVLDATAHPRAAQLLKVQALDRRAAALGTAAFPLDIAVNFAVDGLNRHGIQQKPCIDCGDCVTGCNVGAKNTLPMNYLPMAAAAGAEIYTQAQVEFVRRSAGGPWEIHGTRLHGPFSRERFQLTASDVILAAGAINTTEILLRSEKHGLQVSPRVGSGFGGNGDFFGLAYNGNFRTNVLGFGNRPQSPRVPFAPGPTIVAAIRYGVAEPVGERFLIQDLSFPSGYVDAARFAFATLPREDTDAGDEAEEALRILRDVNPFVPGREDGALNHTMLYLCMGVDDARGTIVLETTPFDPDGRPQIVWDDVGRQAVFSRINEELRQHARAQGASFIAQPLWTGFDTRHLVTAHPLGGCPIAEDAGQGAVDEYGRVFDGVGGVHEGLFVADGALIPSSLGANPFLTICALAERIVERRIEALEGHAYPAPAVSAAVPAIDPVAVATAREADLERMFQRARSGDIDVLVNTGTHTVDAAGRRIRNDRYWKGFFPRGHALNAMSAALFTGFRKRFWKENGQVTGATSDTDGRFSARHTLEPISIQERQGDLDPGRYILLRYVDPPWQAYYAVLKVITGDLLIGRVYLGVYPHGVRLFTFPMTRVRSVEQMSVDDHRLLYDTARISTPQQLQGVWRMDVVSNADRLAGVAQLWFDLKPDGRLEARYQLLGLMEGLILPRFVGDRFRADDFTPLLGEIRMVDDHLLVGRWVTGLPSAAASLPASSLGILHVEEQAGGKRVGFHYVLARTAAAALPTSTLLRPFLDVQLPSGIGLVFDEEMEGWYFPGVVSEEEGWGADADFRRRIAHAAGAPAGAVPCSFQLRIVVDDLTEFVEGAAHEARPGGTLRFGTFEGSTPAVFTVDPVRSVFHYLRVDTARGEAEIRYSLDFRMPDERVFLFEGRKYMQKNGERRRDSIEELLDDYTTLYVRVYRKTAGVGEQIGVAVMKFRAFEDLHATSNLAGFLRSMRVTGTDDASLQFQARMRFLAFTAQFVQREYDPLAPQP